MLATARMGLTNVNRQALTSYELENAGVVFGLLLNGLVFGLFTRRLLASSEFTPRLLGVVLLVGHCVFVAALPFRLLTFLIGPDDSLGPGARRFGD